MQVGDGRSGHAPNPTATEEGFRNSIGRKIVLRPGQPHPGKVGGLESLSPNPQETEKREELVENLQLQRVEPSVRPGIPEISGQIDRASKDPHVEYEGMIGIDFFPYPQTSVDTPEGRQGIREVEDGSLKPAKIKLSRSEIPVKGRIGPYCPLDSRSMKGP
jgi:hypothetical protein